MYLPPPKSPCDVIEEITAPWVNTQKQATGAAKHSMPLIKETIKKSSEVLKNLLKSLTP